MNEALFSQVSGLRYSSRHGIYEPQKPFNISSNKPKALSLSGMGIIIPEVQNGAGRHITYLEPATAERGLKLNFATQPIYLWAITVVKVSIALFLLRISPSRFYTRMLNGIIAFLIIYTFICFLTIILQCKNLAVLWDTTVKTTCWTISTVQGLSYLNTGLYYTPVPHHSIEFISDIPLSDIRTQYQYRSPFCIPANPHAMEGPNQWSNKGVLDLYPRLGSLVSLPSQPLRSLVNRICSTAPAPHH